jgi:hypothetical protein
MKPSPLTRRALREKLRCDAELQRRFARNDPGILDQEIGGRVAPEPEGASLIEIGIGAAMAGFVIYMTWNGSFFG